MEMTSDGAIYKSSEEISTASLIELHLIRAFQKDCLTLTIFL